MPENVHLELRMSGHVERPQKRHIGRTGCHFNRPASSDETRTSSQDSFISELSACPMISSRSSLAGPSNPFDDRSDTYLYLQRTTLVEPTPQVGTVPLHGSKHFDDAARRVCWERKQRSIDHDLDHTPTRAVYRIRHERVITLESLKHSHVTTGLTRTGRSQSRVTAKILTTE